MSEEITPHADSAPTAPPEKPQNIPRNLKPYFLCFLVKGEHWNEPEGAEDLAAAQLAFLREQIEWRRCRLAGPVTADGEIVGFSILEAANAEAALTLANQDPGVRSGRVRAQILPAILPSLDGLKIEFPINR